LSGSIPLLDITSAEMPMVTTIPAAIPMTKTTALKLELQNCSSVIGTVGNYTVGRATVYADRAVSLGWSL